MRALVIFATLSVAVLARPDVSHLAQTSGYQYNQGGNGNGNGNGGAELNYNNNGGGSFNDLGDGFEESSSFFKGFSSYDAPLVSGSNFDNGANGAANIDVRLQGTSGASASSSVYGGSDINLVQGQSKTIDLTGGSSGGRRVVYKPVIKQGEPIITKNFYVHAAPEDDEDVQVEERVQVVRPQKSYKIIFIKAPTAASSYNAANYPIYPQNEEKTIVYVLSKKDDQITDFGEIPQPPAPVTHKPEVFFIKYKTKQEAAQAVADIQNRFQEEAQNANFDPSSISQDYNNEEIVNEADPTDASFLPVNADVNDVGSTAASYENNNGGEISVQGNYESNGHSTSFVPNGQQYSGLHSDSNGGGSSFIPRVLHRINNDDDRKNYLPPNYRL